MVKIDRPFYLDELQISSSERLKLASKHWAHFNESLWIGNIDSELLHLAGSENFEPLLKKFITEDGYKFDIEAIEVNSGSMLHIELVSKACYLLDAYLKSKSFKDPICSHYNPRWAKNVVHPGGTRQVILDLFHQGPVKTFYFNTSGIKFRFLKKMKKININEFFMNKEYHTALVPDHGTLIPHILRMPGVDALPQAMINSHNQYKARLSNSNYKIFSNFELKHFSNWQVSQQDDASTIVHFKHESPSLKDQIKASLLILSGNNYTDEHLSVGHQKGRL